MGPARLVLFSSLAALFAAAGAPLHAQVDTTLAPGTRVRVWVGPPTRLEWRTGRLVELTADSLVVERTDVLGRPRLALPLDSVRRLDVHRGGRDRAAGTGCAAGGIALGLIGAALRGPDARGVDGRLVLGGAGFGCAVGLLAGAFSAGAGEWQIVPILRRAREATPPPPRTPPPPA